MKRSNWCCGFWIFWLAVSGLEAQVTTQLVERHDFEIFDWSDDGATSGGETMPVRGADSYLRLVHDPFREGELCQTSRHWFRDPIDASNLGEVLGFTFSYRVRGSHDGGPGTSAGLRVDPLVRLGESGRSWYLGPSFGYIPPGEGGQYVSSGALAIPGYGTVSDGRSYTFGVEFFSCATERIRAVRADLDDFVVDVHTANAPRLDGVTFDLRRYFQRPNGSWVNGFGEGSESTSKVEIHLLRRGDLSVPTSHALRIETHPFPTRTRTVTWPAGVSEQSLTEFVLSPDLCSYTLLTATLEETPGGIPILQPARTKTYVIDRRFGSNGAVDPYEHAGIYCLWNILVQLFRSQEVIPCNPVDPQLAPLDGAPPPSDASLDSMTATLRAFRDQVMASSEAGRYYVNLYYTWSKDAIVAAFRHPAIFAEAMATAPAWIQGAGSLVAGQGSTTSVSGPMLNGLRRVLDGLKAAGSPALARAIATEESRLGLASWEGLSFDALWQRVLTAGGAAACTPSANSLCLNHGRYRVEADVQLADGSTARAHAVPLTPESGYFWFFEPENVELLTKVLDGCGTNDHVWQYSAGLTNLAVDLTFTDTLTGRGRTYQSEPATAFAPLLDSAFLECASPAGSESPLDGDFRSGTATLSSTAGGSCTPGPEALCLGDRFRVTATWRTAAGASGSAHAAPLTADTGTFWFFSPANVELVVKSIDACGLAGFENYWLFAAGTTDVEVNLVVEDTVAHVTKSYFRPLGTPFAPELDTIGFATCP
ncbi:MAG: hypothetical protein AB7G12_01720 [Thermoanaerobaculia bacterium]